MSDDRVADEPEVRVDEAVRPSVSTPAPSASSAQGLQRVIGNRAASRLVQRHNDGTAHAHRFRQFPVGTDIRLVLTQVPRLLELVASLRPDANLEAEGQIPDVAAIGMLAVWSADMRLLVDADGTPRALDDDPGGWSIDTPVILLADPASRRMWRIGSLYHPGESPEQGRIEAQPFLARLTEGPEGTEPGAPYLIVMLPSFRFGDDPALIEELEAAIAAADERAAREARRRAGPPRWARRTAQRAADRAASRRAAARGNAPAAPGGPGGVEGGTGYGRTGTGIGGGGDADDGIGTGTHGTGPGSAPDSNADGRGGGGAGGGADAPAGGNRPTRPPAPGEMPGGGTGETPADRTQSGSGETAPTDGEPGGRGGSGAAGGVPMSIPMSESERRSRVSMRLTMTSDGYPAMSIDVDGARGTVPLREGESDASLDARLAEMEQRLGDTRDPTLSTRVAGGATTTGVANTAPTGAAAGTPMNAEQANRATGGGGGGAAPGERLPGAGHANAPAWPAQLDLYGVDTSGAITVVTGATNQAAMTLDRGPDVFDYFQRITYTWELIEITGLQIEDRQRASATTGVGAGDTINRGEGQLRDFVRDEQYIADDIAAEHWAVRAAAWQLIGLSAGIRTIGNVISSFVAALTEPINERSIPWGQGGEFLLRCVATPVPSDDALADPDHHVIRASSVRCLPVRVVDVNERATEVNEQEPDQLADLERQLAEAEAQAPDGDRARELRARIDRLRSRMGMGAVERIGATLADLERERRFCEILVEEPTFALGLANKADLMARRGLTDDEYGELHEYRVGLAWQNIQPRRRLEQLQASHTALSRQHRQATTWSRELKSRDHRPNVTLVSEENGQVYQMLTMLGEHRDSREGQHHWVFYDMTSDKTQRRYHGRSTKSGIEGRNEAIRNAFVDFRENAEYGRGTIAIRMPSELADAGVESRMRAAPGATARWMQRLTDLATAAEIAALVVGTVVTGGGMAAMAIGAAGALAGGAVAYHRMSGRSEGDRLELDYETFMDVLAIVGAVVAVMPAITGVVSAVARRAAATARDAGEVASVLRSSRWVQRAEMVDRGLHVFGVVQGVGQTVIQIPYDIITQFQELEASGDSMSPGERRARRAMILLNGLKSGTIGVIGLAQSLGEPMPHVTSDAEIWSRASEAAGVTPPTEGGTTTAMSGGGDTPALPPGDGDGAATPRPDAVIDGEPGRAIDVDLPDIAAARDDPRAGSASDDVAPPPDSGPSSADRPTAAADERATAGPDPAGSAPTARPEGTAPPRSLGARGVLDAARRIIFADRGAHPPGGQIVIEPAANFAAATGHDPLVLGAVEPGTGRLRINGDVLDATPGLAASLEALVVGRSHPTGRRSLGDLVGTALLRQVIRNVFGGHAGVPAGADHPLGRQMLIELARAVGGTTALLDAYFHGEIGTVRDRLRERYGHGRTEAILDAVRSGSLGDLIRLTAPDPGALTGTYGDGFAGAVADTVGGGDPPRRPSDSQRLAAELADAIGHQPLRDALYSGDLTSMSGRMREVLGGDGPLDQFNGHVRDGDIAAARRTLAEARSGPTPVPAEAAGAASRFNESLAGDPSASSGPATDLLRDLGSFELARRLIEGGALGGSAHVEAARTRLQEARKALVDAVVAEVKRSIAERFEGVVLEEQDLGTVGFGSDRDVTLRAQSADPASPRPTSDLIRASTEAVRDAYDLLRQQGLDPAAALDTNFYTELHEGAVTPSNAAERMAISADQTVVSLMEVELSAPGSLGDLRQAQLDALARTEMPDSVRGEMRQRIEQQFATAERRAAEISAGGREAALQRARARLEDALQRTPPPSARELRQLMADVKLLEPDAYGSRAAVEGVVHGQQGLRRAETTADRVAAGRHVGPVGRGEGTLTERLEHRLQQARASLGHLLAHVRPPGRNSVRDVLAVAKQLARILHAFREAGQFIDHPLLDDAGAVVASKSENDPDATIREVRVWAERAGLRFGSEQALLDAYVAEARRLGIEMTTRLGTSTESARSFEGPPTDAPPPDAAPSTPDASAPTMSERPAEMSADRPASRSDVDAVDGDGAAAAARSDGPPLRPHEVAHEQLLDRLRASMDRPIPTPDGPTRPIAAGEVGRARDPNRAYDMFRDAVARAGGREVGLFFERASGTYAVVVGREASVSPPRGNGVWECPIHTHPNPENVLVYRMPAPNDVLQYWQTAMRTGRRASAFIEYPLPEGGRGTCRLEIDPNGDITFEYPGQDAPETLSIGEYQERWDSRTRYVEPGTPQYERFLRDMEDRARDRDRYSGDAALPDDPLAYGFEFRTDDLRSRIDAAPDHPDAPELLGLLEEAEVYREMGEEADAAAMLDEVERRVRLIEPEWRPAAGETEPETGAPTARTAPASTATAEPLPASTAYAARLADLQTALRRLAAATPGNAGTEAWRVALLDTADHLASMRPSEVTERTLADLRGETAALGEALAARNRPVQRQWVTRMSGRLQDRFDQLGSQIARLRRSRNGRGARNRDSVDAHIELLTEQRNEVQTMMAEAERLGTRMDDTTEGEPGRFAAAYDDLRSREAALDRVDGDVVIDLRDPGTRADVLAFFRERATDLAAGGDIGELLLAMMLDHIADADQLVLSQSPRSSGAGAMDTPQLRAAFIADQLPHLPAWYQRAFQDAARGTPDGWPRTSAGHAWEVDHVHELWAGGADAGHNLLALPPALHRQLGGGLDPTKTGLLGEFRRRFRDRFRAVDDQVLAAPGL